MKRYLLFRIIRSIISVFLVTTVTYAIIYSLIPERTIFDSDVNIAKLQAKPDSLLDYKNTALSKMGYIDYLSSRDLLTKAKKDNKTVTTENTAKNKTIYQKWAKENGYTIKQFKISKNFYATKDLPLIQRVGRFYANLISIDNPWAVKDKNNTDLKRGYAIKHDDLAGWAVVGSGTKYYYQVYFNSQFPFVHQNIVHFNLGTSYPTFAGQSVNSVISGGQGQSDVAEVTIGDKTLNTSANIYSRQYAKNSATDSTTKALFGSDSHYTKTDTNYSDPSMIATSFSMGAIAVILAYAIGLPLGVLMARYKKRLPDKIGVAFITVLISVPSLAFIYFFRYIGSNLFDLPDSFPTLGAGDLKSYVLPTIILGMLSISGIMLWIRRYMIDQQSSDYVKFARAKGLSEREISTRHIFKNASIPIVNQVPVAIITAITGATMTETIFAVPGMGKMLPDAIIGHNNPLVIAIVFIFTTVAIVAVLVGDVVMTLVDPRIKLGGK